MRQILIISLLAFGCLISNGQEYHRLLRANVTWDVSYWQKETPWPCSTTEIRRYFLNNEKIINNKVYHVIVYQEIKAPTVICDIPSLYLDTNTTYLFGYFREDTLSQKVYKYSSECNRELILYDFSLTKNDSCKVYNSDCDSASWNIDKINQISLVDGSIVKEIVNNNYYENIHPFSYIESIGNIFEPFDFIFESGFGFEGGSRLICVKENGVLKYGNDLITDIKTINQIEQVRLYPNPASDWINIDFSSFISYDNIRVTNLLGEQFDLSWHSNDKNSLIINLTGLPVGIYYLKIQGDNILNVKFLKIK